MNRNRQISLQNLRTYLSRSKAIDLEFSLSKKEYEAIKLE